MNLLLDTNVFLWWKSDPQRIGAAARQVIEQAPMVFVSVVSAWEVAIKSALGKLRYPGQFAAAVSQSRMNKLLFSFEHAEACGQLPLHHQDPFDRALIVQARHEGLQLVTADQQLAIYDVSILLARG